MVMRHAKATHKPGFADLDRPLTSRGRRDAAAAGAWLRDQGLLPGLVFCSPSCRTRQTWDQLAPALAMPPGTDPPTRPTAGPAAGPADGPPAGPGAEVWYDTRLYHADAGDLRDIVAETPAEVTTLLVVGHNPTVQELASTLTGLPDLAFPTSAIAAIEVADWARLDPGAGTALASWIPREAET